jgi:hypothetical protein
VTSVFSKGINFKSPASVAVIDARHVKGPKSMAKVTIELDLDVVQEAVKANVAPAVAEVLAKHYDIKAMIIEELQRQEEPRSHPVFYMDMMAGAGAPLITELVRTAVHEAALAHVEAELKNNRPALDAAFRRMMKDSPDALVKAFVDMIDGGSIDLDLDMTVTRRSD